MRILSTQISTTYELKEVDYNYVTLKFVYNDRVLENII